MQQRYDEDFLEAAVFLCANGRRRQVPPLQVARFHHERERLYGILDPGERDAAFFRLHLEWFREWGLEQPLVEILEEFPLVREQLTTLVVRRTAGVNEEGAELYVNSDGRRTGVLALRLERWHDAPRLKDYLRHEFMHLRDMLSPEFGYVSHLELPGFNPAQVRLARERYRLLWDLAIDGRLSAAGHIPAATREQHAAAFSCGYSFWPEPLRTETFEALWRDPAPRHAALVTLAADPRGLRASPGPAPGAACPLCGFPTFAWAGADALPEAIASRLAVEFPGWSPARGFCHRCLEMYQINSS